MGQELLQTLVVGFIVPTDLPFLINQDQSGPMGDCEERIIGGEVVRWWFFVEREFETLDHGGFDRVELARQKAPATWVGSKFLCVLAKDLWAIVFWVYRERDQRNGVSGVSQVLLEVCHLLAKFAASGWAAGKNEVGDPYFSGELLATKGLTEVVGQTEAWHFVVYLWRFGHVLNHGSHNVEAEEKAGGREPKPGRAHRSREQAVLFLRGSSRPQGIRSHDSQGP